MGKSALVPLEQDLIISLASVAPVQKEKKLNCSVQVKRFTVTRTK